MTDREKKLCVDCGERPKWCGRKRCYKCHMLAFPEFHQKRCDNKVKYNQARYYGDFAYREDKKLSAYLSKCRKLGRLKR